MDCIRPAVLLALRHIALWAATERLTPVPEVREWLALWARAGFSDGEIVAFTRPAPRSSASISHAPPPSDSRQVSPHARIPHLAPSTSHLDGRSTMALTYEQRREFRGLELEYRPGRSGYTRRWPRSAATRARHEACGQRLIAIRGPALVGWIMSRTSASRRGDRRRAPGGAPQLARRCARDRVYEEAARLCRQGRTGFNDRTLAILERELALCGASTPVPGLAAPRGRSRGAPLLAR